MKVLILFAALALTSAYKLGHNDNEMQRDGGHAHHYYYGDVNHHNAKHDHEHKKEEKKEEPKKKDEVYYFAVGDDMGAYEFTDDTGALKGFNLDLLEAMCDKIGVKCAWVMDHYNSCWQTTGDREYPGIGLLANWFTGCMGYWPYPRRLNSFNFTISYTKVEKAAVFWLTSRDDELNKEDVKGLKIGFIDGWSTSKFCLARETGNSVDDFEAVIFTNHAQMFAALRAKEIDAFLSSKRAFVQQDDLTNGDEFTCNWNERGAAFMMKYGHPAIPIINGALEDMYNDGSYHKLCKEANEKYKSHGSIDCIE